MTLRPALVGALLISLTGCSYVTGPELEAEPLPSPSAAVATAPALLPFYDQDISWRECRASMECGEVTVPLDYDAPAGQTIELSVLRAPAEDSDQRIGSLLVNPGGPGVSAVDYAANSESYFGDEVRAAYDIVGVDPRGVAGSAPIDCLDDADLDALVAADPDPDDPAEWREATDLLLRFGRGCQERSGDLTAHVSTPESARDLDVVRSALGQETLAFFGASYGTFLGATYADLFPQRVGRIVLDGAVDPTLGTVEKSLVQAEGFETALRAYVGACVDEGECLLGDSVDSGTQRVGRLLEELDADPLPGDGERVLTEGLGVLGIWAPLYNEASWPALDVGLEQALRGNGEVLLDFADQYVGRGPESYVDNSSEALYAVNCLDSDEVVTLRRARALQARFEEVSPTFGRIFASGLPACNQWPVRNAGGLRELRAEGAAPILVVGTSRDPATPLAWARALASQLDSGVLVTRDGDGHTGYLAGNDCVDDTVEEYLVAGSVPDTDVVC